MHNNCILDQSASSVLYHMTTDGDSDIVPKWSKSADIFGSVEILTNTETDSAPVSFPLVCFAPYL